MIFPNVYFHQQTNACPGYQTRTTGGFRRGIAKQTNRIYGQGSQGKTLQNRKKVTAVMHVVSSLAVLSTVQPRTG